MTKVQILEQKVEKLGRGDLMAFRKWFLRYDSEAWDIQIERDANAGNLDAPASEAVSAHKAGKTREL